MVNSVVVSDERIKKLEKEGANLEFVTGAYGCSTEKIDYLSDLLNSSSGVLGSKLTGAGLGGCVVAIVEKEKASAVLQKLKTDYYDRFDFEFGAKIYLPMSGSCVIY